MPSLCLVSGPEGTLCFILASPASLHDLLAPGPCATSLPVPLVQQVSLGEISPLGNIWQLTGNLGLS